MIVIKIELWPGGFENHPRAKEIGRMCIANDGEVTPMDPRRGNYIVNLMRRGTTQRVQRSGRVEDYPRESYSVWELAFRALKAVGFK